MMKNPFRKSRLFGAFVSFSIAIGPGVAIWSSALCAQSAVVAGPDVVIVQWDGTSQRVVKSLNDTADAHLTTMSLFTRVVSAGAIPETFSQQRQAALRATGRVVPLALMWLHPFTGEFVVFLPGSASEDVSDAPSLTRMLSGEKASWPTQFDAMMTAFICLLDSQTVDEGEALSAGGGETRKVRRNFSHRQTADEESPFDVSAAALESRSRRTRWPLFQPSFLHGYGVSAYNFSGGMQHGYSVELGARLSRHGRLDMGADLLLRTRIDGSIPLSFFRIPSRIHLGWQFGGRRFLLVGSSGLVLDFIRVITLRVNGRLPGMAYDQIKVVPGWMNRLLLGVETGHRVTFYVSITLDAMRDRLKFSADNKSILEVNGIHLSGSGGVIFKFR